MSDKCLLCGKKYNDIENIYSHMEKDHNDSIPKNFSTSQAYYALKSGKDHGSCIICHMNTAWNESTHKYNRFCDMPKCKDTYREEFKKRMVGKYGKVSLLKDPEQQKKMLANRSISGKYTWSDGKELTYTGTYELDFLKFMDVLLQFQSDDVWAPSPHTYYYTYQGEEKFYIPDFFIASLDLEIEIKPGGANANQHPNMVNIDKVKEKLKDEVLMSQKEFNYVKLTDKNYEPMFKFLDQAKERFAHSKREVPMSPIFIIGESLFVIESSEFYTMKKFYPATIAYAAKDIDKGAEIEVGYKFKGANDNEDDGYAGSAKAFFDEHEMTPLAHVIEYDRVGNLMLVQTNDKEYSFVASKNIKEGDKLKVNWDSYRTYFGDSYKGFFGEGALLTEAVEDVLTNIKDISMDMHPPVSFYRGLMLIMQKIHISFESDYLFDYYTLRKHLPPTGDVLYVDPIEIPKLAESGLNSFTIEMRLKNDIERKYADQYQDHDKMYEAEFRKWTTMLINNNFSVVDHSEKRLVFRSLKTNSISVELDRNNYPPTCTIYYTPLAEKQTPIVIPNEFPAIADYIFKDIMDHVSAKRFILEGDDTNEFMKILARGLGDRQASRFVMRAYPGDNTNLVKDIIHRVKTNNMRLVSSGDGKYNLSSTRFNYLNVTIEDEKEFARVIIYVNRNKILMGATESSDKPNVEFSEDGNMRYTFQPTIEDNIHIQQLLDSAKKIWIGTDYHLYKFKDGVMSRNERFDDILHNQQTMVKDADVFIFLGDLVDGEMKDPKILESIIKKLKGIKIMVLGNNDTMSKEFYKKAGFEFVVEGFKWRDMIFSHQAINHERGTKNIHGHFHGGMKYYDVRYDNHIGLFTKLNDNKPILLTDVMAEFPTGKYHGMGESSEEVVTEGILFSDPDTQINMNGWKREKGKNALFITGLSGSGKSTLATELAKKHHAHVIHLDLFESPHDVLAEPRDNVKHYKGWLLIHDYYNKVRPEIKNINFNKDTVNKFIDEFDRFIEWLFKEIDNDPDNLYIVEGVQIIGTLHPDYEKKISNKPLIIMGTSAIKSMFQGGIRDMGSSFNVIKNMIATGKLKEYKSNYDQLQTFKKMRLEISKEAYELSAVHEDGKCDSCGAKISDGETKCKKCGWTSIKTADNEVVDESIEVLLTRPDIHAKKVVSLFHGTTTKYDTLQPVSKTMGTRLSLPRYTIYLTDDYNVSYIIPLMKLMTDYAKTHDKIDRKNDYSYDMDKGIFYLRSSKYNDELLQYLKDSKVYIYHVDIDTKDLTVGHVPNEFSVDKELSNEITRIEVLSYNVFRKYITILKDDDMDKQTEIFNNRKGPYISILDKLLYRTLSPEREIAKFYLKNFVKNPLGKTTEGIEWSDGTTMDRCPYCATALSAESAYCDNCSMPTAAWRWNDDI